MMNGDLSRVTFDETNPDPRCACVLVLDTSGSMHGRPIDELNNGLIAFGNEIQNDTVAQSRVEVAIVTFGPARLLQDFTEARNFSPPTLQASGDTPLGSALQQAFDLIRVRKQLYKDNGVPYYRPWVLLITDGAPNDNWQHVAQRIKDEENAKGVVFYAVGVAGADMNVLRQLSVRTPMALKDLSFKELFVWLSASLSKISQSQPGQQVALSSPSDFII